METTYAQESLAVINRLSESAQISLLKFAQFLEADENGTEEDAALYDEAMANDDGYRISADDLRKKYGL